MPTREIVTITCQWGANTHPLNFYTSGLSCLTSVGLDAWTKLPFTYCEVRLNFLLLDAWESGLVPSGS